MKISNRDALIIVDVQNDFCPGGSLPAPHGDKVASVLADAAARFAQRGGRVAATQDWHPEGHASFKEQGGPWPVHCVQGSHGAAFHSNLNLPKGTLVVQKGSDPKVDAYSGFIDSDLETRLRNAGVQRVFVGGLVTEFCVFHTVKDAVEKGFETYILTDAIDAVNVHPGDGGRAIEEMKALGAHPTTVAEMLAE